jgi:polyisoprenoid-binding protein YceI
MTLLALILLGALTLGVATPNNLRATRTVGDPGYAKSITVSPAVNTLTFRLEPTQSRFIIRTFSGGLLWFKGHDHFIAPRNFTGEATITPGTVTPASLQFTVHADSLVETRDVFTEQQKQIINKEIRELVLEITKYPEIIFKSTGVTGRLTSADQYEAKIEGDLTLHGVTRRIAIPAAVTLSGQTLRARGEFEIKRSDYKVKATSALHGTIRVRDRLKLTYEIVANQT